MVVCGPGFYLEDECFARLCWFLLCGDGSQLYVYIDRLPLEPSSHPTPPRRRSSKTTKLSFPLAIWGFPGGSDGKESACNAGDLGSIPGSGRPPGEWSGYPLWHSYRKTPWRVEPGGLQSLGSQRVLSLPPTASPLFFPSRTSQSPGLSPLCYTAAPH